MTVEEAVRPDPPVTFLDPVDPGQAAGRVAGEVAGRATGEGS
jgi:hypothetical protein